MTPATADAGASRVFLLTDADGDGEWLLRSAARTVEPPTPDAVLTELFNGPSPEEFDAGFESALPETLGLRTAIAVAGALNVDVTTGDPRAAAGPAAARRRPDRVHRQRARQRP